MSEVLTKEIFLDARLTPRAAEVAVAEIHAALRGDISGFRFALEKGFLPTIGWLERLTRLLKPLVEKKLPIELVCESSQVPTLRRAGLHLIADITCQKQR